MSKLALIDAGIASRQYPIVAVSLFVSLLTLLSMIRIWAAVFWNPIEEPEATGPASAPAVTARAGGPPAMLIPTAAVVACSLAVGAAAGPLYSLSERTADELLERTTCIAEVGGR